MELFRAPDRCVWQLRFTDHRGNRRQLSTRREDRSDALAVSHKIERIVGCNARGDVLPPDLIQWAHATHKDIVDKLLQWNLLAPRVIEGGRYLVNPPRPDPIFSGWKEPPPSLVDMWSQDLADREVGEKYVRLCAYRVTTLLQLEVDGAAPIAFFGDISPSSIDARIKVLRRIGPPIRPTLPPSRKKRKSLSPKTCNHYLDKLQEFCAWAVGRGMAPANPIAGMAGYSPEVVRANVKRQRRAFTLEEQITLVTWTECLATRWNMDGKERQLLYRFALSTGLRAKECYRLRACSFNLFAKTVVVLASQSKASREDTLPLRDDLVDLLRPHLSGKHPQAPAFSRTYYGNYCRMLNEDLDDLAIPFIDAIGRYADFHALRHTFGTELAKVVMPAEHQQLMRHKDIKTTMNFYTHLEEAHKAAGVAKLPSLEASPSVTAASTQAG